MKLGHHLVVFGLVGTLSVGCASEDATSTSGTLGSQPGSANAGPPGGTGGVQGGVGVQGGGVTPSTGSTPGVAPGAVGQVINAGSSPVCSTQVINAYGTVPDMLIVLDRSLSMTLELRWDPSKQAVKTITSEFEGLMAFGLVMFPGSGAADPISLLLGGACGGDEKLDVPLMIRNAAPIAQAIDRTMTMGLTPTGAALERARMVLGDRRQQLDVAVKPGYVLLVTDGDPSCDPTTSAGLGGMGDPTQQEAARAAVKALKEQNIPTYVIGYQIAPAAQPLMNELAMLGGTNMYRPAESGDQVIAAFRDITKDVIKCTFDLQPPADGRPIDPKFVRVQIDNKSIPLNSADGWVINGNSVTLQGGACATLKDGKGHNLNAQVECTEVILN